MITIPDILVMHFRIMRYLNPSVAGIIRKYDVMVGNRRCYPHFDVYAMLNEWRTNANNVSTFDEIKQNHIWFEMIHPFGDGNGRAGRMILLWQSQKAELPFAVIRADKKGEYYMWFQDPEIVKRYRYRGDYR